MSFASCPCGAGRPAALVLLVLAFAFPVDAQAPKAPGSITGRVVSAANGQPVKNAIVLLEERPQSAAEAGSDGTFTLKDVPAGTYHLLVTAQGFVPERVELTVAGGPRATQEIVLNPELHFSEVISVSGTPRDQFVAYQPTSVLAGQELAVQLESSLGAALQGQPGLAERSFGPASSRPVIRGLDGDRVLVLEDGQRTGDLSSQSGDHGVTVNPAAATRLEVVRGPAALLYGANAIGGLVNVIHDQIPSQAITKTTGAALFDAGTAATEGGAAADINVGNGRWAFRAGASGRGSGDMGTPEGTIDNTQSRAAMTHIGLSHTDRNGFVGVGYGYSDMRYGVPVVEEGLVELTPRRHSVTVKGERRNLGGFLNGIRGSAAYRRYRHDELVGGDPETRFENDTIELDALANHRQYGRMKGTFGAWGLVRSFEAIGEEALSPPVDQRGFATFLFEEFTWPHVTLQFGGRYDRASYDVVTGELPNRAFDNASGSVGLLLRPRDDTTIALSLARAARSPALEELYFFGPHPGNFAFEIGNANLVSEQALGVDVAFRWRLPRLSGEVTYFRNDISDYIFRQPVSEQDFAERYPDEDPEGFPIVEYVGADSMLQGFEAHADVDLTSWLVAEIGMDYVRGELSDGRPLPRMPPFRFLGGLRYQRGGWQLGTHVSAVARQSRVYEDETETAGYTLVKAFASYSFNTGPVMNILTARLDNATNELYRNHLSLIKDYVPEMGRNFKVVYNLRF